MDNEEKYKKSAPIANKFLNEDGSVEEKYEKGTTIQSSTEKNIDKYKRSAPFANKMLNADGTITEINFGGGGSGDVTKSYVDTQDTNLQTQIDTKVDNITSSDSSVEVTRTGNDVDLKVLSSGGSQDLQSVLDNGNTANNKIMTLQNDNSDQLILSPTDITFFTSSGAYNSISGYGIGWENKFNLANDKLFDNINYDISDLNTLEDFDDTSKINEKCFVNLEMLKKYLDLYNIAPVRTTYSFGGSSIQVSGVSGATPQTIIFPTQLLGDDDITYDNVTGEISYIGDKTRAVNLDFVTSVQMTAGASANMGIQLIKIDTSGNESTAFESGTISVPLDGYTVVVGSLTLSDSTITINEGEKLKLKLFSDVDSPAQTYELKENTRFVLSLDKV